MTGNRRFESSIRHDIRLFTVSASANTLLTGAGTANPARCTHVNEANTITAISAGQLHEYGCQTPTASDVFVINLGWSLQPGICQHVHRSPSPAEPERGTCLKVPGCNDQPEIRNAGSGYLWCFGHITGWCRSTKLCLFSRAMLAAGSAVTSCQGG